MFTHAVIRPPGANFAEGLTTVELGTPDLKVACKQHTAYCEALQRCGLTLVRLDADDLHFPDSTFVEDAAILTPRGAILMRPGAPSRSGEVDAIRETLQEFYPRLDAIIAPGTVDGGDICEAGDHFFIGISHRTNEAGARKLAEILARQGYRASCVDIRGIPNILHIKSGIAYLGESRLVLIDALAEHAAFRDFEVIRVPAGDEYAANCVRVNEFVLIPAGFPELTRRIEELGYATIPLAMSEFQKMDGGLSCLSLRFTPPG
ncbi:MAG: N(G),N(G)-dimethylarginine dimethylaminohydrolase [Anaerolineales bacterium]|nr:N(G),N(G)-dimethylarginine dimethylaminohydrolase [Anaerolineales bacterium]